MTREGPCRVLLVGMMGSGKSTIGRLLADATGWPYVDNDDLVLRSHGMTARRLLADRGEEPMRRAESEALSTGLRTPPPAVIGVAAGVILDDANRAALREGGIVVWLRANADELASRAAGADHRPWLDADAAAWMAKALAERAPLYALVADHAVDTDASPPAETAAAIVAWLAAETACAGALRIRSGGPP